jgi:hypothetical protein
VVHTQYYNSGSMLGCDNLQAYGQGSVNCRALPRPPASPARLRGRPFSVEFSVGGDAPRHRIPVIVARACGGQAVVVG